MKSSSTHAAAGLPYAVPPIFEAIVELRFRSPLAKNVFSQAARRLKRHYSSYREEQEVEVTVRIDATGVTPALTQPTPVHRFASDDETDRCRLDVSKIHWARLPPYEGWEPFQDRIERDLLAAHLSPKLPALERIGVRYRNRIDVPTGPGEVCRYEDYLNISLGLPPILDPLTNYNWRIDKDFTEPLARVTVASSIMPPELPFTTAFLLDIDVAATANLPKDWAGLLEKLAEMRTLKNDIFEAAISNKARKGFS